MLRFQDHLVDPGYLRPIRAKIGEGLREKYDLMEPVPQSLVALLRQLETGGGCSRHHESKTVCGSGRMLGCDGARGREETRQPVGTSVELCSQSFRYNDNPLRVPREA
jgi:hypothetical protein